MVVRCEYIHCIDVNLIYTVDCLLYDCLIRLQTTLSQLQYIGTMFMIVCQLQVCLIHIQSN